MIIGWEKRGACRTNIESPDIVREPKFRGYLETRDRESFDLRDAKKTICRCCGTIHRSYYDRRKRRIRDLSCGEMRIYLELEIRRVRCRKCKKVKVEKLEWLSNNPFYTKRFSFYVGRKCRAMTIQDVSKELKLDWHTVKALDKEYMREQLRRNPVAAPRAIVSGGVKMHKIWRFKNAVGFGCFLGGVEIFWTNHGSMRSFMR